jgi:hypothetical protein
MVNMPIPYQHTVWYTPTEALAFIDNMEKQVFKCDGPTTTKPINIEEIVSYGDCWGVGHDCTLIDKDGTRHQYKFEEPTTT